MNQLYNLKLKKQFTKYYIKYINHIRNKKRTFYTFIATFFLVAKTENIILNILTNKKYIN